MKEPQPYAAADLGDALESAVLAVLRTPPIRQALYDLLRIYGMTAQTGEVIGNQHEQIQALAEAMTIFHARLIEHDRRAVASFTNTLTILDLVRTLAATVGDPGGAIATAAADALALLQAEADVQIDLIESEAARARVLLRVAQNVARSDLADAVATAATMRAADDTEPSI